MNLLRYSVSREICWKHFSDDDNRTRHITLLDNIPNMENRFQEQNIDPQPQRILFDVSALSSGRLLPSNEASSEDGSIAAPNLRRQLFLDPSPTAALQEEDPASQVTAGSATQVMNLPTMEQYLAELGATDIEEPTLEVDDLLLTNLNERRKRSRVSYSKKFFYASSSIYLEAYPTSPLPETLPELLGQITCCPSKRNDYQYRVRWIEQKNGGSWPASLSPHLRTTFPKELIHVRLTFLIRECPLNNNNINLSQTLNTTTANRTSTTTPICVTEAARPEIPRPPEIVQTPAPSQRATFAAMYTAGSVSGVSGISSLGQSLEGEAAAGSTTPPRPRTRRQRTEDYDSDHEDTDAEDNYEVDFSENFWLSRRLQQQLVAEEDDDVYGSDDEEIIIPHNTQDNDYGQAVKECPPFNFRPVSPEEAATLSMDQKIYDGESGLKRGVARSFSTPLRAVQRAGLTTELVARWVKNSNK